MQVLTRNGKALKGASGVIVQVPPYWTQWNYLQALAEGTANIYDWMYKCFSEGFSVNSRTVDGYPDPIQVDGGSAQYGEYMVGFRKLVIPLAQFNLYDTVAGGGKDAVKRIAAWVTRDNPELLNLEWQSPLSAESSFWVIDSTTHKIVAAKFVAPPDDVRQNARQEMALGIAAVKTKIAAVTGFTVENPPASEADKRNVAKVIHDWIMEQKHYGDLNDYWSATAYSAISMGSSNPYPVCTGYSKGFALICKLYSINAIVVYGQAGASGYDGHAWNYVSFTLPIGTYTADASKWAPVDVNWDDSAHDALYSDQKTYEVDCVGHRVRAVYRSNAYKCVVPVTEPEAFDPTKWEALTTDDRYYLWRHFCTYEVYHDPNKHSGVPRINDDMGYPVAEPTAYYPYCDNTGHYDTLYGIAEADWIAPSGT